MRVPRRFFYEQNGGTLGDFGWLNSWQLDFAHNSLSLTEALSVVERVLQRFDWGPKDEQ